MRGKIETAITKQLGIPYPIVGAPMFLCSNLELVAAVSNAGGVGCFPAQNYRTPEDLDRALTELRTLTDKPYGVNIIVSSAVEKQARKSLEVCVKHQVPLYITSLGKPHYVIEGAHKYGAKVWCDVTTLKYAQKVVDLGADALVAVCKGAGGHAGPTGADELVPLLKKTFNIPVLQAGGIADGKTFCDALARGADAAYVGTRFIASDECSADDAYKQAIVRAKARDIIMVDFLSGTPCAVINTEYVQHIGPKLNPILKLLIKWGPTKKLARGLIFRRGMGTLERSYGKNPYQQVWSAGETVEFINSVEPVKKIIDDMVAYYRKKK